MTLKTCRSCGEPRDEKTGACRNGCSHVTAQSIGSSFIAEVHGQAADAPAQTVSFTGLRRNPTNRE